MDEPSDGVPRSPEEFFDGVPGGLAIYQAVAEVVATLGDVDVRVTKSQIAFRGRKGFASVWWPGRYVRSDVPAVLSFMLPREVVSERLKEVAHPSPGTWTHHVELHRPTEVDEEVRAWLAEAHEHAR